jgi:uncharacterized protein (TIGR00369 family)
MSAPPISVPESAASIDAAASGSARSGLVSPDPDYTAKVRGSFDRQAAMTLIGAAMTRVEPGFCEVQLPYRADLTQQHGFIHGGIVAMIADSACGYAGYSMMPPGGSVLTVEYKINMLSPGQGERLIARGRVLKPGKSLVITQCEVFAVQNGAEKLVAVLQQTLMVMRGRKDDATESGPDQAAQAQQQQ